MTGLVDISDKPHVSRRAKGEGFIRLDPETVQMIREDKVPKGDVLTLARTAGVMAVKRTPELIPLAHPIPITGVDINFELEENGVKSEVEVKSTGQTGVEMEVLAGVTSTLLTIWDMTKGLEKDETGQYPTTRINDVKVIEKVKK